MTVTITTSATDGSLKILTGTKQEVLDECVDQKLHPVSLAYDSTTTTWVLLCSNLRR